MTTIKTVKKIKHEAKMVVATKTTLYNVPTALIMASGYINDSLIRHALNNTGVSGAAVAVNIHCNGSMVRWSMGHAATPWERISNE